MMWGFFFAGGETVNWTESSEGAEDSAGGEFRPEGKRAPAPSASSPHSAKGNRESALSSPVENERKIIQCWANVTWGLSKKKRNARAGAGAGRMRRRDNKGKPYLRSHKFTELSHRCTACPSTIGGVLCAISKSVDTIVLFSSLVFLKLLAYRHLCSPTDRTCPSGRRREYLFSTKLPW